MIDQPVAQPKARRIEPGRTAVVRLWLAVVFSLLALLGAACGDETDQQKSNSSSEEAVNDSGADTVAISEEDAVEAARGRADEISFDLTEFEPDASIRDGSWVIDFIPSDSGTLGGGLRVTVDGDTGEVTKHQFLQ